MWGNVPYLANGEIITYYLTIHYTTLPYPHLHPLSALAPTLFLHTRRRK